MKISIGQITTLPKTMEQDAVSFEKAGFKCVELAFPKIKNYLKNHTVEEMRELFDAHGLQAVSAIGLAPTSAGILYAKAGEEAEGFYTFVEEQIRICVAMGCDFINFGGDPSDFWYDGWESQALINLRKVGEIAAKYNMRVAFEDAQVDRCVKLVCEADRPNIGFCLDLFWYHKRGFKPEEFMTRFNYSKLINIHFCDLPKGYDVETMDDSIRVLPGEGILPLQEWIRFLREGGYDGYLCLELLNEDIWAMESDTAAVRCMDAMLPYIGF